MLIVGMVLSIPFLSLAIGALIRVLRMLVMVSVPRASNNLPVSSHLTVN